MEEYKKEANEKYFQNVLAMVAENGLYTYKDLAEVFVVKNGVFYGSRRGVRAIREITPKRFHKHVQVKEKAND